MPGPQVGTITLSCDISTPSSVIIRPIGTGLLNQHKVRTGAFTIGPGGPSNYQEVDEVVCDDTLSFVVWNEPSIVSDLYLFEDISLPSNYEIKSIIVTAKNLYDHSLSTNYKYKLLIYDGSDIYRSPNLQIKNGLGDYWFYHTAYGSSSWAWSSQPSDDSPLTQDYINNLQIGVETSSPTDYDPNQLTIVVTGAGDLTELTPQGSASNWENINEDWIFSETDYNYTTTATTWKYDLYGLNDYPLPSERGPISHIIIHAFCRQNYVWGTMSQAKTAIKTYGNIYYGTAVNVGNQSYWQVPVETTYTKNPFTGNDWTWPEIDALQAGIGLYRSADASWVRCACCFVEVFANSLGNAQIATSQIYATLNISINTTETCSLPKPVDIDVRHEVDARGLNFWSGNREVYALGRTSKRTVLSGIMWDGCTDGTSTCEDIINCIRTMAKRQLPIALTGLRYSYLNTNYNIISFAWKKQFNCSNISDWELELEFCDESPGGPPSGFTYTFPMELS
ncbi:MAG: hypothetical protein EHM34_00120 [Nitrosopumilales archaeon]|nr:MAG: hypothetical protein EHM34_00120 [Nitrosopumilales archaeon]